MNILLQSYRRFTSQRQDRSSKFDYEKILYDTLMSVDSNFKDKHLWVKKGTGLSVTEFMLRLMAWLCISENHFRNCQMCIVTGPNIERKLGLISKQRDTYSVKRLHYRNLSI